MKALFIPLIGLLLAACGPSPEQLTATAVMAQTQTQAAAPTLTPTLRPIPTVTPKPHVTSTATAIPLVTVKHSAPKEKAPSGLPQAAVSKYLRTIGGGFVLRNTKPYKASFNLSLSIEKSIPSGALIEVLFENPLDPTTAIVVQVDSSHLDYIQTPLLTGIQCKTYWVEVHIYSDSSKTTELGSHLQWLRSDYNTDKIKDVSDFVNGASCKN